MHLKIPVRYFYIWLLMLGHLATAQPEEEAIYTAIGTTSEPATAPVVLTLYARFQNRIARTADAHDHYDRDIQSPKSINYLPQANKFYVHSLEGFRTVVYSLDSLKKRKVIHHVFNGSNQHLFKNGEYQPFDYHYKYRQSDFNIFKGKPVESTFSHNGRYLWVTYYRRSYDHNSQSPSAVALIDTETDEIVRVMPTGILPKMIASSPDNRYVVITHWGDNTLGVIDITGDDPMAFHYVKHLTVNKRLSLNFDAGEKVNRDKNCGYCLRGTTFTPDSRYLLVGRMGGGGIAVFDVNNDFTYLGTTFTPHANIRHLLIKGDYLYMSTNVNGYVDKLNWHDLIADRLAHAGKSSRLPVESCFVGKGARTIVITEDGRYVFVSVNNASKIAVVDTQTMKLVASIAADSFPVGLELAADDKYLLSTAQGRYQVGGGHTVCVYKVSYRE